MNLQHTTPDDVMRMVVRFLIKKYKEQCIENERDFHSFLQFVTKYPDECFDER